ncbi:MAG: FadR/GntR family transcriptional regulator [Allobaculum sp.]
MLEIRKHLAFEPNWLYQYKWLDQFRKKGWSIETKLSAKEVAIDYLLGEIKSGNLKPGDKILNERKLSGQLGISRVPLREAISILSSLNILEARQGDGTYVSEQNTEIFGTVIKKYGIFTRSMVDEVFEARALFEADAAKLAAKNRTAEDLEHLHEALLQHENALEDFYAGRISAEQMMSYDHAIHLGIAASTHNNFLLQMVEAIRHVTMEEGFFSGEFTVNQEHFKESAIAHRAIVDAIEKQDGYRAYQIMQEHIGQIQSALDLEKIRSEEKHEEGHENI